MTKENRLYGRLTLDFADHPKIAALSDRAFRELIECILWSRRLMTDGFIQERMVPKLFSPECLTELTTNDPDKPSLVRVEGGYRIHDFEEHQQTRAEIEMRRAAGSAGGRAKARNAASKRVAPASDVLKQTASKQVAITETETETGATGVAPGRARATRIPDPFILTREMRDWAAERYPGLNVDKSTERFVNHFRAKAGRDATKLDWLATWRNWIIRDGDLTPTNGAPVTRARENVAVVEHYARKELGA